MGRTRLNPLPRHADPQGVPERRDIALGLALFSAACAVYAQVVGFEFVRYDDGDYVTANPHVLGGLTASGLHWAWTQPFIGNWQPLTWMSHMLDVELFGLWAGGHHIVSVLLHGANSALVFAVLALATGARGRSAAVAAIFALHPLHVESVAWVSERKDVLSTFFGLLAMGAYVADVRSPSRAARAATFVCLGLGLLAKAMLVTLPCVLLLLDRWPLERKLSWKLVAEKWPLFALTAGFLVATVLLQVDDGATNANAATTWGQRTATALVGYVGYLRTTLWPVGLGVMVPHPYLPHAGGTGLATWQVAGSAALLVAITLGVLRSRRGYAELGWLWFLGMLVPVIGLVQIGVQGRADRYMYLALVGLSIPIVWGSCELAMRWLGEHAQRRTAAGVGVVLLCACCALTWQQTSTWRDSRTLYQHAVDLHPGHAMLRLGLGEVLAGEGDLAGAASEYRTALAIAPDLPEAHANYAGLLRGAGDLPAALHHYRRAVALAPDSLQARSNEAGILMALGRHAEAIERLSALLSEEPDHAESHYNLANALLTRGPGALAEATHHYRRALALKPGFTSARFNLAHTLVQLGRFDEAAGELQIVQRERPDDARVRAALEQTRLAARDAR